MYSPPATATIAKAAGRASLWPPKSPAWAIGVDLGGTKIAAGLVNLVDGTVLHTVSVPTNPQRGGEAVLSDVLKITHELKQKARETKPACMGVGVCELVNDQGRILSENCLQWRELPILEKLSEIAPALLEADVRAAAAAEAAFGHGRQVGTFLYVTVGTGISCCLVIDGKPFTGARGATGTFASVRVPDTSTTLEGTSSGPALVTRYNELAGLDSDSPNAQAAEEVFSAARAGDPNALAVIQTGAQALGAAIGWLVSVLDPERVVVGGGVGLGGGIYWDILVKTARSSAYADVHRNIALLPAATGAHAGIIGAAVMAWRHLKKS